MPRVLPRCAEITPGPRGRRRRGGWTSSRRPLDRGAEVQPPAAEGDRAEREPRPAEHEPRDHVREPVDVEQHAARGDRDRDRRRRRRRAAPRRAVRVAGRGSAQRGVERRRGGRVPARERRAERLGERVERRSRAVDQVLDRRVVSSFRGRRRRGRARRSDSEHGASRRSGSGRRAARSPAVTEVGDGMQARREVRGVSLPHAPHSSRSSSASFPRTR